MNYEVYSYWNLAELQGAFNAIAALTGSGDFNGLLRLLALVAIVSLVLAVLSGRARHEDFWRWVIMLAVVNGMLLVPKATVVLIDRTSSQPNRVVANVPIGLAALAHGTSKIGDWLTRAYETVFALPNDLQFQRNGLMFGHRLLTESVKLTPEMVNGVWMRDFQEFWRECVMPDLASGYLPLDTLRRSHDFWGELDNTNPALYVTLSTAGTVNCPAAYTDLTNRFNGTVVPAMIQLQADMVFPGMPANATAMRNAIVSAYAFGLGVTNTAESIVKQQMTINAAITAYCNTFAQLGNSSKAALCYSSSMGGAQTNYTYQVLAKIAESSMPKLKSAIELIQYAVFPIIVAFAIVAGHLGLGVLKTYTMSLVWVQLWPPLYAVVHYIQTSKLPEYANQLAGLGDTMQGQIDLLNLGVSDQAIAGMLVIAIPPIAAALVKGGEVGLQAVAGLVSAPRTAERQAADNAKGNESMGQWKTTPTVDYSTNPTPVMARRNDDGSYIYAHPDGSTTFNVGTAMDRASTRASTAGRVSVGASMASEKAETAAVGNMVSAGTETAASFQQLADFVRAHAKGASSGTSVGVGDMAKLSQSYSQAQDIARNFEKQHGLKEGMGARVMGSLAASGGLELAGNGVKAELKAAGFSDAEISDEKKMAEAYKQAKSFQDAMERVHQVSRQSKYDTGESSEAKAMQGIRTSLDQAQRHSEQASANLQRSRAFKELAQKAKEGSVTVDQDITTLVMNRFAAERFQTADGVIHDGMAKDELDHYMRVRNDPVVRGMFEKFANEETAKYIEENYGGSELRKEDVRKFFEDGKKKEVLGASDVAAQGKQWLGGVVDTATKAGVDPTKGVTSALPRQVAREMRRVEKAIDGGKGKVEAGGKPIESTVTGAIKDPGSLLAKAASNASTSVLPQGTTFLLDKVGATPGAFAKREAETYKGNTMDALMDTAIFAGSLVAGGVVGHAAGKAVGKMTGSKAGQEAGEAVINKTLGRDFVGPPTREVINQSRQAGQEAFDQAVKAGARDGLKVGIGAGAMAGKTIADNRDHGAGSPGVLDGAWRQGENLVRETFGTGQSQAGDQPPVTSQAQLAPQTGQPTTQQQPVHLTESRPAKTGFGQPAQAPVTARAETPRVAETAPQASMPDFGQGTAATPVQGIDQADTLAPVTAAGEGTAQPSGPGANAGVLDGAWNQGENAAGDLFSGSPGSSNLGKLLSGGQRPVPAQPQPVEGAEGQQKGDAPPPSGR